MKVFWQGFSGGAVAALLFGASFAIAETVGSGGLDGIVEAGGGATGLTLDDNSTITDSADGTFLFCDSGGTNCLIIDTFGDGDAAFENAAGSNQGSIIDLGQIDMNTSTGIRSAGNFITGNNDAYGCYHLGGDASAISADTAAMACTSTSGLMAISDGGTGQGQLIMSPEKVTADPCGGSYYNEGTLLWDDTSNEYCVCIGGVAESISDYTTNCF